MIACLQFSDNSEEEMGRRDLDETGMEVDKITGIDSGIDNGTETLGARAERMLLTGRRVSPRVSTTLKLLGQVEVDLDSGLEPGNWTLEEGEEGFWDTLIVRVDHHSMNRVLQHVFFPSPQGSRTDEDGIPE